MAAQLNFEVTHQTVKRTDEFEVVQMSKNYLRAHFDFLTDEWQGQSVTAIFITEDAAYSALLDDRGECIWKLRRTKWAMVGTLCGLLLPFSRSVASDSLRPHGLQPARPPCPSPDRKSVV